MNAIKHLRESMGVDQAFLARKLSVSQPTVSDWETGRKLPSNKSAIKLAEFFGVTVDYIYGREEPKKEKLADNVGEPMSPLDKELYDLLSTLSVEEKEMLLASIKAVKSRREQPASPQQ